MNLSNLSLEEALKLGVITRGSWNDDDWDIIDLQVWRKALSFAEEKHKECNSTYISKMYETRSGKTVPYIVFIQKLMRFLASEVHLTDDYILTIAALYNITNKTNCTVTELENLFGRDIANDVVELNIRNNETLGQYITRCMERKNGYVLICVLLSVMYIEECEVDICPFESWKDDIPYYKNLIGKLEPFVNEIFINKKWNHPVFIGRKLLNKVDTNLTLSYDVNKTADELYSCFEG